MAVTAASFKTRYEVFDGLSDARIQLCLDDALRQVGDNWLEADRDRAIELFTAHLLVTEGALSGGAETVDIDTSRQITQEKLGDATTTWTIPSGGGAMASVERVAGGLQSTIYGRQYAVLLKQNNYGPLVA